MAGQEGAMVCGAGASMTARQLWGRAARAALRTARNNNAKRTWRRVATTAVDNEMRRADGRGGLTDAAGRSKDRSRDFVVVRSATRVDWLRRRQDAALVLPTRADTLAH